MLVLVLVVVLVVVQYLCEGQKEHINKSVYAQIPIATPLNYSCSVSTAGLGSQFDFLCITNGSGPGIQYYTRWNS